MVPFPIKLPVGIPAHSGPRVILERPKIAGLLGAIAAEYGITDGLLALIFNFASLSKPIPVGAQRESQMAKVIFETLVSFPARIEMIQRVMELRFEQDMVDEFFEISTLLRKRAKERAALIHAEWYICDKFPAEVLTFNGEQCIKYTEKCFTASLDRAVEIRNKLNDFSMKVAAAPKKDVD